MSIRRRILMVYLVTLIPLLFLGFGVLYGWYSAQHDVVESDRLNNARLVATHFATTIDDIASTSLAIGDSAFESDDLAAGDPELRRMVQSYPLHFAAILDDDGRITHSSDPTLLGRLIDDPIIREVREGVESAVGVNRDMFGMPGFLLAQRVSDAEGRAVVAVQLVDPVELSRRLGSNPIAGGAHVVDSEGQVVVVFEYPRLGEERQQWGDYAFIRSALDGREAVDFDWTFPPTGARRVAAAVPIPGIGWEAGSAVDYDLAFAAFERSLTTAVLIAMLVLLTSGLAVRWYALSLIRAVRTLAAQSEVLGRREIEPVPVVRTGDELEQVSRALDRADRDLRAYIGGIETIADTGQQLSAASISGHVDAAIINAARRLFDATAVWVFLHNESTGMLHPAVWYSEKSPIMPKIEVPPGEGVAGRVFETGEVALIPDVNQIEELHWRKAVTDQAIEALVEIPLVQSGGIIGVLGVFAPGIENWQLGGREIGLLTAFGAQVTIALENSRLYESERLIAETLQQALLLMPENVEGVTFAYAYHSGTNELLVGGDFFDLFELGENRVGILIGDVAGKGLQGAVLTSLVKDTVRAHADEPGRTPAQVVERTNQMLERQSSTETFVTLFLGYLDTRTGLLTYCNAGHSTGALTRTDRSVVPLPATSSIVGAFADLRFEDAEVQMDTGDLLFLYTDGLTEARRDGEFFGEERLFELLGALADRSPSTIVDSLGRRVSTYAGGQLHDDLAILAVRLGGAEEVASEPVIEDGAYEV